jgi:hypothetical protein
MLDWGLEHLSLQLQDSLNEQWRKSVGLPAKVTLTIAAAYEWTTNQIIISAYYLGSGVDDAKGTCRLTLDTMRGYLGTTLDPKAPRADSLYWLPVFQHYGYETPATNMKALERELPKLVVLQANVPSNSKPAKTVKCSMRLVDGKTSFEE